MKKKNLILWISLVSPIMVFAEKCKDGDGFCIKNPVNSDITSIEQLLTIVLKAISIAAIPIIVLAFIWSGFKFVKSQGNSKGIADAKRTFGYTILGTAVILGSNVILELVTETTKGLGV